MPVKISMFDHAIPVLASLEIATLLDYFHKPGFATHNFGDNYGIVIREYTEIHFWLCTDKHVANRIEVGEIVETPWAWANCMCTTRAAAW